MDHLSKGDILFLRMRREISLVIPSFSSRRSTWWYCRIINNFIPRSRIQITQVTIAHRTILKIINSDTAFVLKINNYDCLILKINLNYIFHRITHIKSFSYKITNSTFHYERPSRSFPIQSSGRSTDEFSSTSTLYPASNAPWSFSACSRTRAATIRLYQTL